MPKAVAGSLVKTNGKNVFNEPMATTGVRRDGGEARNRLERGTET